MGERETRLRLIEQARRDRQIVVNRDYQRRVMAAARNAAPLDVVPLGLPAVIAALGGDLSIEDMAFSLGWPVLEQHEVASFFAESKAKAAEPDSEPGDSTASTNGGE